MTSAWPSGTVWLRNFQLPRCPTALKDNLQCIMMTIPSALWKQKHTYCFFLFVNQCSAIIDPWSNKRFLYNCKLVLIYICNIYRLLQRLSIGTFKLVKYIFLSEDVRVHHKEIGNFIQWKPGYCGLWDSQQPFQET